MMTTNLRPSRPSPAFPANEALPNAVEVVNSEGFEMYVLGSPTSARQASPQEDLISRVGTARLERCLSALACRWKSTSRFWRGFETLRRVLRARSVGPLSVRNAMSIRICGSGVCKHSKKQGELANKGSTASIRGIRFVCSHVRRHAALDTFGQPYVFLSAVGFDVVVSEMISAR